MRYMDDLIKQKNSQEAIRIRCTIKFMVQISSMLRLDGVRSESPIVRREISILKMSAEQPRMRHKTQVELYCDTLKCNRIGFT